MVDPDGAPLPAWEPGAHLDVLLPSGLVRQYSLCGDPRDQFGYTIAVLNEPVGRGGSAELHECALAGSTITVRGPRNHFRLEQAPHYVFVAGGIGITPILAMVREVARGSSSWTLYYSGRTAESMAFREDLASIGMPNVRLFPSRQGRRLDLHEVFAGLAPGTAVYCCGPSRLIDDVRARCARVLPEAALHVEHFTAPTAERPAPAKPAMSSSLEEFDVELRRTGCVVRVRAGQTILDAVREVAPSVLSSCEEGFCGTCETPVLEGVPLHHDTVLSDVERQTGHTMMICVGRAASARLVLDL
jgi:ferredoxin-NADP reductase